LIEEWLRQLKIDCPELQQKIGLETLQAWVGDQLTVGRLQNIFQFRSDDDNGPSQAFDVLQRKSMGVSHIQGPFFHHIAEAQIREAWLEVSGANNPAELRTKIPEELSALADKLRPEHASTE
ncbi:hypothetical protein B0H13DRAFT_1453862, partial [Mycena leptocephala]